MFGFILKTKGERVRLLKKTIEVTTFTNLLVNGEVVSSVRLIDPPWSQSTR